MSARGEPLRILQVMRAPVGGLFRHVSDLTRELSARGHMVGIVADSQSADAQTELRFSGLQSAAALGIHRMPIPRLLGPQDLITPIRIKRLAMKLNISILHGHGAKGGFGARISRWGMRERVAVYTPHGGALHFDPRSRSGAAFMRIERALLGVTDALIFESAYAQATYVSRVAQPQCRQEIIHNGLAESEFERIEPAPDAADFVFIGELRLLKGIDLLIEAIAPLARPDGAPATLVVAGDGPDKAALAARIAELGLGARVALLGVQPAREMFARGRCVVVPSRAESLPYIVMEAAAAGRPVIATNVGGVREIYGPTADRLIASDSISALRTAMATYLANPEAASAEALTRRDFVAQRFSLQVMSDAIEALYASLTSNR